MYPRLFCNCLDACMYGCESMHANVFFLTGFFYMAWTHKPHYQGQEKIAQFMASYYMFLMKKICFIGQN